ncbi:GDP-mannose 4,6 dehydratase [Synechococcus sp. Ace-Pa]|nr:GDP-mannose 4,6 dehydratase [Synechococcus sp. Ace-Pa]
MRNYCTRRVVRYRGIQRRASSFNTNRLDHLYQDPHERNPHLNLHYGDLTDSTNLIRIIQKVQPA